MGGADSQLLSAAQVMRARGHDVLIVSLTPLGPMGLQARSLGIRTESLEMPRGIPDPRGLLRLVRLVRAWRPDVVHSHMVHANLLARALRLIAPVPALVSTIHNIYEGGRLRMAAYRLTNAHGGPHDDRQPGGGGSVHRATASSRRAAHASSPTGWTPSRFRNVPPGTREALRRTLGSRTASSGSPSGASRSPRTIPTCSAHSPGCASGSRRRSCCWSGKGRCRSETEALVRELGLGGAVRFLGVRDDVPARHERRRRLRDVVGLGGHADGAAGGGGGGAADRRHDRSAATTRWW